MSMKLLLYLTESGSAGYGEAGKNTGGYTDGSVKHDIADLRPHGKEKVPHFFPLWLGNAGV